MNQNATFITFKRGAIIALSFLMLWQLIVVFLQLPNYILPSPLEVLAAFKQQSSLIIQQSLPTIIEMLSGLFLAIILGGSLAIAMIFFRPLGAWFLPLLILSQAIPVFAIAPLLVIWFGYGLASKIITTMLMLFFPIASNFYDGLRRVDRGWLELAQTMNARRSRFLLFIAIPAALPSLATGLRVATAMAPMGAVIGEWVGASKGLGFLLLFANARMQIPLMFACLVTLILFAVALYFGVDKLLKILIPWGAPSHE